MRNLTKSEMNVVSTILTHVENNCKNVEDVEDYLWKTLERHDDDPLILKHAQPKTTAPLKKWGNSQGVRLSKDLLTNIGVTDFENTTFDVATENGAIILTPRNSRTPFEQLFEGYDGDKPKPITDWDDEQGNEIWK